MREQTFRMTMNLDVAAFHRLQFDEAFFRRLYLECFEYEEFNVLELEETEQLIRRKAFLRPKPPNLPRALAQVIPDASFTEELTFDKVAQRYRFHVTPSFQASRATIRGETLVMARGAHQLERVVQAQVEIRIPLVGSMIEDRILADLEKGLRDMTPYFESCARQAAAS